MTQASFVQHGMWMADRESGAAAYHMPLILHLGEDVDIGVLSKACAALVGRHELLAAALTDRDGAASLVELNALRVVADLRIAPSVEPFRRQQPRIPARIFASQRIRAHSDVDAGRRRLAIGHELTA